MEGKWMVCGVFVWVVEMKFGIKLEELFDAFLLLLVLSGREAILFPDTGVNFNALQTR